MCGESNVIVLTAECVWRSEHSESISRNPRDLDWVPGRPTESNAKFRGTFECWALGGIWERYRALFRFRSAEEREKAERFRLDPVGLGIVLFRLRVISTDSNKKQFSDANADSESSEQGNEQTSWPSEGSESGDRATARNQRRKPNFPQHSSTGCYEIDKGVKLKLRQVVLFINYRKKVKKISWKKRQRRIKWQRNKRRDWNCFTFWRRISEEYLEMLH